MSEHQGATKLNPKQRAFCAEYIKDHNATQAAIRAGYSERTAYSQGQRLLKNVEALAYVAELEKDYVPEAGRIASENLQFWIKTRDNPNNLDRDRIKASELLGKYAGMFIDRIANPDGSNLFPSRVIVEVVRPQEGANEAS